MTKRIHNPDTSADEAVRACLESVPPTSFIVIAGAGSGKTTSLIKAIHHLATTRRRDLVKRKQRIACITYTEDAKEEIAADVGFPDLVHISTIHSFLWELGKSFTADIRSALTTRLDQKIAELQVRIDNPRTRIKDRLQVERDDLRRSIEHIRLVPKFDYGTGSKYAEGILGHDDVLTLIPGLISAKPLFRTLVAQRFPFILVDESQDTQAPVVQALQDIQRQERSRFCVGFFGDPMQKIYTSGSGRIVAPDEWVTITKPENFRCPTSVLNMINVIRGERDDLAQVGGRAIVQAGIRRSVQGNAKIFVGSSEANRDHLLAQVKREMARRSGEPLWTSESREADIRVLVLVHRVAAQRLGFANLYAALHDKTPASLSDGVIEGTAWPVTGFLRCVLPAVHAFRDGRGGDTMHLLSEWCPRLSPQSLKGKNVAAVLSELKTGLESLSAMLTEPDRTVRDVLNAIRRHRIMAIDERFLRLLDEPAHSETEPEDLTRAAEPESDEGETPALRKFLACSAVELWGYRTYVAKESAYATQQVVKGQEFARVLVVVDEDEPRHMQFSYQKYFRFTPPSETDQENQASGKDSALDRTQRLFYVCCSRATQDLAVLVIAQNVPATVQALKQLKLVPDVDVHELERA